MTVAAPAYVGLLVTDAESTIFDILRIVDMEVLAMLRLFKRTRELTLSFCERCGSVCDSVCHAEAIREHALQRALAYGWRQA